jgi:NADPH:quinone reductase-like Zn-dependent oxidoreductase
MKAVVYETYGRPDVLRIVDLEKPVPGDDEVLVRVRASSVNPAEWYTMTGLPIGRLGTGLFRPKNPRLGVDYAGVVEAAGRNVTGFKPGDQVYGARSGAFAEYVCARKFVFPKPAAVSFEQAGGAATAAVTALQGLRDHGELQPGQSVLINGASGGVGTFAVQIARALGGRVTAVCSPPNLDLVRSLGAERVIDYTKEDFTRGGERYDLLLDVAGRRAWGEYRRVLKPDSHFVMVGAPKSNPWLGPLAHVIKIRLSALGASQKVVFFVAVFRREDFLTLSGWFESGAVKPVVEKVYPLEQIAEAMRRLGAGHARGKIVVSMP